MHLRLVGRSGVVDQGSAIESYEVKGQSLLLGRRDPKASCDPDIDLQKYDDESRVSRRHALLELQGEKAFLQDLQSLNGTYLNGRQLEPYVKYELKDGDCISVAKVVLRFDED